MELSNAKEALDTAFKMVNNKNMPQSMIQFSYDYNLAEYYLLSGNAEKGRKVVEQLLNYGSGNLSKLDRLLIQLSAADMLQPQTAAKVIEEYRAACRRKAAVSLAYQLLCARLMYIDGDAQEAQVLTEEVLKFSRANKNSLRLVEADLLLLHMTKTDDTAGKRKKSNLLREAVYYAWGNRIFQPFYVDREILSPILKGFYSSVLPDLCGGERKFMQQVMTVCACGGAARADGILSARELEVLGELAKGLTNPEIAARLCISVSTVKTHVLSIYGKLGVSSRLMAVKEGKALGLVH